jgi:hypothetical protein
MGTATNSSGATSEGKSHCRSCTRLYSAVQVTAVTRYKLQHDDSSEFAFLSQGFVKLSCQMHETSSISSIREVSSWEFPNITVWKTQVGEPDCLGSDQGFSPLVPSLTKTACARLEIDAGTWEGTQPEFNFNEVLPSTK